MITLPSDFVISIENYFISWINYNELEIGCLLQLIEVGIEIKSVHFQFTILRLLGAAIGDAANVAPSNRSLPLFYFPMG